MTLGKSRGDMKPERVSGKQWSILNNTPVPSSNRTGQLIKMRCEQTGTLAKRHGSQETGGQYHYYFCHGKKENSGLEATQGGTLKKCPLENSEWLLGNNRNNKMGHGRDESGPRRGTFNNRICLSKIALRTVRELKEVI